MVITVASPALTLLPSLQNAVLGAGLGLRSQTSTGTIASTNTATAAILGLANLQLSVPVQANPTASGALGTLWTPKHLTISLTNTSGETITGIDLSLSDADATASADPAAYSYGQADDFPSAGIATGASALVTYTMLGPVRQYPLLTLTFGTAPTAGSVIVTTDLSGEGSAASVLKGSLAPKQGGMVMVNSNQTLDLASGGGTLTITIQPPIGQLWRGRGLQLNTFPYPTDATGNQYFSVFVASVGFSIASNGNLSILGGNVGGSAGGATWPSSPDSWYTMLAMLVATHAQPVQFVLENYSSAANTGNLGFSTAWEVEAIDDIT